MTASPDRKCGVVLTDAFYSFRDGVDGTVKAGVKTIIHSGGSRKVDQLIEPCNEHGIAMIFTSRGHFKH